ncbi:nitronate monooxygenase [Bacillus mesophilus]|nr:nitronate monooxygenase [Bacillus mesophilus]MBM7659744.1 nitronate monooxygenase [Bacillus mesophilus]
MKTRITEMLSIKYPIIQAPMAGGITTTDLVTAACNAGTLGMIGAGYLSPEQLQRQIHEIKNQTSKPFGVNLFVPTPYSIDEERIQVANQLLAPFREQLSVTETRFSPVDQNSVFEEQIHVLIEEEVKVCSFTFGLPSEVSVNILKGKGIVLVGTATNVKEAIACEKANMDMVVLQGSEAGGHRGTFDQNYHGSLIGLMSLIPQVSDHVQIPLIAAGGIMDGRGLVASLSLGAEAVQMGTAFLTTLESGAHPLHKEAILEGKEDQTVITRAFSGKPARGFKNRFVEELETSEHVLPEFPIQNSLTQSIRKAAAQQKNAEYLSLWSGQSPTLAKAVSVQELIQETVEQAEEILMKKW